MKDCIFCKIIKGEIPCWKVYEDKNTIAILTIGPVNQGHTLVIPKKHYENLFDLPETEAANMMKVVKKISEPIMKAVNAKGINLGMNNGLIAGQEVPHAHIHIMPRFKDDGFICWPGKKYKDGEMDKVLSKIKTFLKTL